MKHVYKLSLVAVAASLVLVNCGSGSVENLLGGDPGGDDDTYVPTKLTGQFVDTYVKGLSYTCTGMVDEVGGQLTDSGVTNEKGEFTCSDKGELIEFSLGSYVLGSYQDSGFTRNEPLIVSPYDLYRGAMTESINVAQLLQTLDDHSIDGVLTIPEGYTGLNDVSIKLDDPDFDALMADALNVNALVSEEVAQAHLAETLASLSPETAPAPDQTEALKSFVSGKLISVEGELEATFASDGSYSEIYQDEGSKGTCSGTWKVLDANTLETICTKDGNTVSEYDRASWEFSGELKDGMEVVIQTVYVNNEGPVYENFTVTITVSDI